MRLENPNCSCTFAVSNANNLFMETLTIEYDAKNVVTQQILDDLLSAGVFRLKDTKDEFDNDFKRAISGDELMNRLSVRIHKMFENAGTLSS